jgi:hypothetical protein
VPLVAEQPPALVQGHAADDRRRAEPGLVDPALKLHLKNE